MREPPDWDRYSDREIQESIATNAFLAVGWLRQIFWMITIMTFAIVGIAIRYFEGWRNLFAPFLP